LSDGSYRSELRWNSFWKSTDRSPIPVGVVEYTLEGVPKAKASYRLVANILEPQRAPAEELAALYHERWEIETAFDEFKAHLRGAGRVLRSKPPELVRQEACGFLLAHFAIRALMHEAVLGALPALAIPGQNKARDIKSTVLELRPCWRSAGRSVGSPGKPVCTATPSAGMRRTRGQSVPNARRP
jgi:hypothetical protein